MITYRKGPLGWAVLKSGLSIGIIKRLQGQYLVSIVGFKPGDGLPRGSHLFASLKMAQEAVERRT